jgi:beta-phosphoglucomutase-like phosphatase (HAD superfamily)
MCDEIGDCKGATELVEELAKTGIPMAIATSSQYNAVEKKKKR